MARKAEGKGPGLGGEATRQGGAPVAALLEKLAASGDDSMEGIIREARKMLDASPTMAGVFAREVVRRLEGDARSSPSRRALERLLVLLVSNEVAPATAQVAAEYY